MLHIILIERESGVRTSRTVAECTTRLDAALVAEAVFDRRISSKRQVIVHIVEVDHLGDTQQIIKTLDSDHSPVRPSNLHT